MVGDGAGERSGVGAFGGEKGGLKPALPDLPAGMEGVEGTAIVRAVVIVAVVTIGMAALAMDLGVADGEREVVFRIHVGDIDAGAEGAVVIAADGNHGGEMGAEFGVAAKFK